MNENEQNFESLSQLLKLKQHEVPPPGYFNGFSSQVISSIRQNSSSSRHQTAANTTTPEWLARFLSIFDTRPGLLGGLATSMVLFLVLGVVLADHADNQDIDSVQTDASLQTSSPMASAAMPGDFATADQNSQGGIMVSSNPVTSLQPSSSIFGQDNNLFQMASYAPAGEGGH